jgi:hypothetical protein
MTTIRLSPIIRIRGHVVKLVVLLTACLGAISAISAGSAAASTAATPLPATFDRETYNYTTSLTTAQEANRYKVMVLQSTNASKVPLLHAANPKLKILVYQDGLLGRPTDPHGWTACTDYPSISANHPDWFLKDQYGNRILDRSYPDYLMDVGNPAYQKACVAHAIAMAKQYGFDGVYLDDVTAWVGWTLPSGVTVPEYATTSAWQAAMYSYITYAATQMHANGLMVLGNIGGSTITTGLWQKWVAPLDGSEEQSWTDAGAGLAQQVWTWPQELANAAWSEANNKLTILHSFNTTEAGNVYGLASMMLVGNGNVTYSTANANYNTYEMWYPEYTEAQQLGAPMGPYSRLSNGVYERVFANGVVVVNPTTNSVGSLSLGGGLYSSPTLTSAKSVSLGATSGQILMRVG